MVAGADLQHLSSIYDEEPKRATGLPESIASLGYKGVEVFCAAINLKNYSESSIPRLKTLLTFPQNQLTLNLP